MSQPTKDPSMVPSTSSIEHHNSDFLTTAVNTSDGTSKKSPAEEESERRGSKGLPEKEEKSWKDRSLSKNGDTGPAKAVESHQWGNKGGNKEADKDKRGQTMKDFNQAMAMKPGERQHPEGQLGVIYPDQEELDETSSSVKNFKRRLFGGER